jgi:hypothetical protein
MSVSRGSASDAGKRAYVAPVLTAYGSVRNLTGGSPDGFRSDGGSTRRND